MVMSKAVLNPRGRYVLPDLRPAGEPVKIGGFGANLFLVPGRYRYEEGA